MTNRHAERVNAIYDGDLGPAMQSELLNVLYRAELLAEQDVTDHMGNCFFCGRYVHDLKCPWEDFRRILHTGEEE